MWYLIYFIIDSQERSDRIYKKTSLSEQLNNK